MDSNKIATNVYLEKRSVKHFEESTRLSEQSLNSIGEYVYDTLHVESFSKNKTFNILDTGTGTGRTITTVLENIRKKNVLLKADCFDVSPYMLSFFENKLKKYKNLRPFYNITLHDANDGLEYFGVYDLAMFVSVLHYFDDWRKYLRDLTQNHLNENGSIVIAELIGWYRWLDGVFDYLPRNKEEEFHLKFWKEYFLLREHYGDWKTEIAFSYQQPVYDYLLDMKFEEISSKDFEWDIFISWEEVLSWIQYGPVSSLGSNITVPNGRIKLMKKMKEFLLRNEINLSSKFKISWGFKILIFKKND